MKRFAIAGALFTAAALAAAGAGDVWQQLGVPVAEAGQEVVSAFANGSVNTYRVRDAFRKATPETRAALVEQVLNWTKAYVSSPQFAKDYAAYRAGLKPAMEERPTVDAELAERRAKRKADLEEAKKNLADIPAEYRKAAEEGYKASVEAMKQLDTPEFAAMERQGIELERQNELQQFEQALADWDESYPADPKGLVRERLTQFLDATGDVAWEAKTVKKWNKMVFEDEELESKPAEWKLAYRAGKLPTEKARAFAKAWLAELK